MALGDKFKGLADKAKGAAAERKDKIDEAVQKTGQFADKQTKGKYSDKIQKATAKADTYVEKLDAEEDQTARDPAAGTEADQAGQSSPPTPD